jgi:hypothetical protein
MGADIWLGKPGESLARFRDSYTGAITLNAIGLSYWVDLWPKLEGGAVFPLALNGWLLDALKAGIAERLDGPEAARHAGEYLALAQLAAADPGMMIDLWRQHAGELVAMVERSISLQVPLYMSL